MKTLNRRLKSLWSFVRFCEISSERVDFIKRELVEDRDGNVSLRLVGTCVEKSRPENSTEETEEVIWEIIIKERKVVLTMNEADDNRLIDLCRRLADLAGTNLLSREKTRQSTTKMIWGR